MMKRETRRGFIQSLAMISAGSVIPSVALGRQKAITEPISLGIIADAHVGFVDDAEMRFRDFLDAMKLVKPDGLMQLGDFAYPNKAHQKIADDFNDSTDFAIHTIGNLAELWRRNILFQRPPRGGIILGVFYCKVGFVVFDW